MEHRKDEGTKDKKRELWFGCNSLIHDMTRDELADMINYLWLYGYPVSNAAIKAYRKLIGLKG